MFRVLEVEQTTDVALLVEQFIRHCRADNIAESTMPARISRLNQFAQFCKEYGVDITQVNNVFMDHYYLEYSKGRKLSSVNASRRVLKVFFAWLEDYKEMQLRTVIKASRHKKEPKRLPKALDREVILAAIDAAEDPYDALMIETEWRAGLRISELVGLREGDIKGDELFIQGKGKNERIVYVTNALAEKLEAIKTGDPNRRIFRNSKKKYSEFGVKAARLHIQRVFEKIGVKMHPHQLRHSFAVDLLLQGCDIISIKTLMGHEDVSTTQIYLRLADKIVKKQYKKFMV